MLQQVRFLTVKNNYFIQLLINTLFSNSIYFEKESTQSRDLIAETLFSTFIETRSSLLATFF